MPPADLTTRQQSFLLGIPVGVRPESIDLELASMWKAADPGAPGGDAVPAVTRVCLANILWVGTTASCERARRILARMAAKHPSRMILVEIESDDPADQLVEAYVNAQCTPGPDGSQVCCEIIHLRIGGGALRHMSGLVAPLLLPDVETLLWYFSPTPGCRDSLSRLRGLIDVSVTEASMATDPAGALEEALHAHQAAYTLAWFRIGAIREQVASLFDDADTRQLLPSITTLKMRHDGQPRSTLAAMRCALTAGWFAARLGWQPIAPRDEQTFAFAGAGGREVAVVVEAGRRSRNGVLESIEVTCSGGESLRLSFANEAHVMERMIRVGRGFGTASVIALSELEEAEALGAALVAPARALTLFRESGRAALPLLRHLLSAGGSRPQGDDVILA